MNLPWVSRLAYESVRDERDRLRTQNDTLVEHVTRMDRLEHGAPELIPERRKKADPMSEEVARWIGSHDSQTVRARLAQEVQAAYRRLGSWDRVWERVKEEQGAQAP